MYDHRLTLSGVRIRPALTYDGAILAKARQERQTMIFRHDEDGYHRHGVRYATHDIATLARHLGYLDWRATVTQWLPRRWRWTAEGGNLPEDVSAPTIDIF